MDSHGAKPKAKEIAKVTEKQLLEWASFLYARYQVSKLREDAAPGKQP